jgi:regulation of enolase protein 1 (concanavalin A-like superfamily)
MQWYNEPPSSFQEGGKLSVTTGPKTDFWRKTHYGFVRDNGHFYYRPVPAEFSLEVKVSGQYGALYDHAGLMVRLDEANWLKTGIEYVNGVQHVSAVVTRNFSDWSVVALPQNPPSCWLQLARHGDYVEIKYSLDGNQYTLLRLHYFPPAVPAQAGVMAAAPEGQGFSVTFEGLKFG